MNGTIGKQMVDTLVESASNVEVSFFSACFTTKINLQFGIKLNYYFINLKLFIL